MMLFNTMTSQKMPKMHSYKKPVTSAGAGLLFAPKSVDQISFSSQIKDKFSEAQRALELAIEYETPENYLKVITILQPLLEAGWPRNLRSTAATRINFVCGRLLKLTPRTLKLDSWIYDELLKLYAMEDLAPRTERAMLENMIQVTERLAEMQPESRKDLNSVIAHAKIRLLMLSPDRD